jgi:hypothetical protein
MTGKRDLLVFALTALALMQGREALADSGRCFDLALPTLEKLLVPGNVQRLFIQVKDPVSEARLAAATLSGEAKRRGIEAVLSADTWDANGESEQDHVVRLCKENSAQLVARVQFLTGSEPGAARVEFWDQDGHSVGSLVGWMTDGISCPPALADAASSATDSASLRTWYGWEMLPTDIGSLVLSLVGQRWPLLVTYIAAPAAIHAANGRGGRAVLSVALRALVPLSIAITGAALGGACFEGESPNDHCRERFVTVPLFASAIVAAIVDDFLLAWKPDDTVAHATEPLPSSKPPGLSLGVGLLPVRQGAGFGLAGHF